MCKKDKEYNLYNIIPKTLSKHFHCHLCIFPLIYFLINAEATSLEIVIYTSVPTRPENGTRYPKLDPFYTSLSSLISSEIERIHFTIKILFLVSNHIHGSTLLIILVTFNLNHFKYK